jgi:hypothetical protein
LLVDPCGVIVTSEASATLVMVKGNRRAAKEEIYATIAQQ